MAERWFIFSTSARTEARVLAFIDTLMSLLWVSLFSFIIYSVVESPDLLQEFVDENPEGRQDLGRLLKYGTIKKGVVLISSMLRPTVSIILALMLFVGAQKKCYLAIRICFVGSIIYLIIDLILIVPRTIYLHHSTAFVLAYVVNGEYMLYELRVVYYLMTDLEQQKGDEESDTNTDDTVVVEADKERTATPTPSNNE